MIVSGTKSKFCREWCLTIKESKGTNKNRDGRSYLRGALVLGTDTTSTDIGVVSLVPDRVSSTSL